MVRGNRIREISRDAAKRVIRSQKLSKKEKRSIRRQVGMDDAAVRRMAGNVVSSLPPGGQIDPVDPVGPMEQENVVDEIAAVSEPIESLRKGTPEYTEAVRRLAGNAIREMPREVWQKKNAPQSVAETWPGEPGARFIPQKNLYEVVPPWANKELIREIARRVEIPSDEADVIGEFVATRAEYRDPAMDADPVSMRWGDTGEAPRPATDPWVRKGTGLGNLGFDFGSLLTTGINAYIQKEAMDAQTEIAKIQAKTSEKVSAIQQQIAQQQIQLEQTKLDQLNQLQQYTQSSGTPTGELTQAQIDALPADLKAAYMKLQEKAKPWYTKTAIVLPALFASGVLAFVVARKLR